MNTLPPSNAAWHPTLPSNTSQPVAVSSLQTQHAHPGILELSNLSYNAIPALSEIENQPSDGAQLTTHEQQEYVKKTREVALQTRIGICDKMLLLVASHENADAHYQKTDAYYQQTVFLSEKNFADATLTVHVRLNERNEYDLVRIKRQEQSSGECISIVVPGPSQPANTYAPTPQGASSLSAHIALGHLVQARARENIAPAGTLRRGSIGAGDPLASSAPALPKTIKAIRCKHKPGATIDQETFKGCEVTDDELESGNKTADRRVRKRRQTFNKAILLGFDSTAQVSDMEKRNRAANKGFPDLETARMAERKKLAEARGFSSLQLADMVAKDRVARKKGFRDRIHADQVRRDNLAVEKGFINHKHALQVQRERLNAENAAIAAKAAAEANNK